MAFATVEQLGIHLQGINLSLREESAQQALDEATGLIQDHCRQELVHATTTVALSPYNVSQVRLPQRPVIAVTSVADDGRTLLSGQWRLVGDTLCSVGRYWCGPVTVTYEHGYTDIPITLRTTCLQVAARIFENPRGMIANAESTTGNRSWPNLYGLELSRAEKYALRRFKRTARMI